MNNCVKIGAIGLGKRGMSYLNDIYSLANDVDVEAVCDLYPDRVEDARKSYKEKTGKEPYGTTDYQDILKDQNIDLVIINSAWESHIQIAVDAMNAGKYVAVEVGGAYSINDCWRLVRTAELTGMKFMIMENCCYGREELLLLKLIKNGDLGDVVHCGGGYRHDLRNEIMHGKETRHYRLRNYIHRNCDNYPTHALLPIMKMLNINRGNRMISLTSTASCAKGLHEYAMSRDDVDKSLQNIQFCQGDIVTTVIKCYNGQTITLTLDTTTPQYYSRDLTVIGTKGRYTESNLRINIEGKIEFKEDDDFIGKKDWGNISDLYNELDHPLWKEFSQYKDHQIGHGGMDWLVFRALIETYKGNLPSPIDVYDTASAMCISDLSEQSIALGSQPVAIPDFTNGKWIERKEITESKFCLEKICEDNTISLIGNIR